MFKRKPKDKQVIQQEPVDTNPMLELAKESAEEYKSSVPTPPLPVEQEQTTEPKQRWVVGEVATSTEKILHDNQTQKSYDIYSAIALILNKAYEE